jgi:glycosyltransferase involved in cell wall biosynthesis
VVAIEASGLDETYAWELVSGSDGFERLTLFPQADSQKLPKYRVAEGMAAALDRIKPTAAVIPGWSDSAALGALHWCVRNHVPAIVMSESTEWDTVRSGWREAIKERIVGLCSAALVGGKPHRDYMVELGMPAGSIFCGYDAVDNNYFLENLDKLKTDELKSETRKVLGLPEKYFLASARFIGKKNLPRLLKAYSRYCELVSNSELRTPNSEPWHLVLLGDGELRSSILQLRSSLGLDAYVHLPGFKQYPDLPTYYGLAQAFVHVSTIEPWGLVVNEAMASGLPVLVSKLCGCALDLVQEGVNGFTVDPYNVEEMANRLFEVSRFEPFRLTEMGVASQQIISDWGPNRFASSLASAVNKALEVGPIKASLLQRSLLKAAQFL